MGKIQFRPATPEDIIKGEIIYRENLDGDLLKSVISDLGPCSRTGKLIWWGSKSEVWNGLDGCYVRIYREEE